MYSFISGFLSLHYTREGHLCCCLYPVVYSFFFFLLWYLYVCTHFFLKYCLGVELLDYSIAISFLKMVHLDIFLIGCVLG